MLSILGSIYGNIANARNRFFDRGVLKSFDLGARTVSIGNLTTGGTGKTPLTAYAAKLLIERGETVCILTRGYGRREPGHRVLVSDGVSVLADASEAGDEPVELAHRLSGKAIIVADRDRVAAAEWARGQFSISYFLLDDGFQHRRARRDVDIVCIDAADPFGDGKMLPAGRLREPTENLARADIVVIMTSGPDRAPQSLRAQIRELAPAAAVFEGRRSIAAIRPIGDAARGDLRGISVFGFCGLAKPLNFRASLHQVGVGVSGFRSFADHHRYTQREIGDIEADAKATGAEALVTTAKDAVKFADFTFQLPCFVAEMDVVLDDPEAFRALL